MKKLSEVKLPPKFVNEIAENVNYTPDSTLPPECYYYLKVKTPKSNKAMNEQELSNYIMGNHVRIDEKIAHIAQKNSGRKGMTPFTLACYVWQALQNFKTMRTESVILTAVNNWDSLTWKNTNIPIGLWNRLFNDYPLSPDNWRQIACPLMFVEDIVTSVTVSNRTKLCHFAYISTSSTQKYPLICTDTAYRKTMSGKASKLTTYIYGEATGKQDAPYELLRHEAIRIVMPIRLK